DFNVKRIKGRKPVIAEAERLKAVKKSRLVDKAVLGGLKNHLPHILKQKPAMIALGYDQSAYVNNLKLALKKHGLSVRIARLKAFKPGIYKSSLVKAKV
ncbi:MAG TPA: FAD synthase, partial [Candidatus Limnocylindria bacterium]|nr:FAD synthase [Candidatus Limnocylindria bacterium]